MVIEAVLRHRGVILDSKMKYELEGSPVVSNQSWSLICYLMHIEYRGYEINVYNVNKGLIGIMT